MAPVHGVTLSLPQTVLLHSLVYDWARFVSRETSTRSLFGEARLKAVLELQSAVCNYLVANGYHEDAVDILDRLKERSISDGQISIPDFDIPG